MKGSLFHGSPNLFENFDYGRIGTHGTAQGFGFYFTDNKQVAENYSKGGYVYHAALQGVPLSGNSVTLTVDEYILIVKILDGKGDFLSNYGDKDYEGLQTVLKRAIDDFYTCKDDAEIIGGLINAYGSKEEVLKTFYSLDYGYIVDKIVDWGNQTVYVALTDEAVKIEKIERVGNIVR